MAKLRKMLCDIESQECIALMRLIETQSKATLASWAIRYAEKYYLPVFAAQEPENHLFEETISACREHLAGEKKLAEIKPLLREATQAARDCEDNPVAQAAARALSVACATVQTPTNALGFLFYGSAAAAYSKEGLEQGAQVYDALASEELRRAYGELLEAAVENEPKPAKIKWNC